MRAPLSFIRSVVHTASCIPLLATASLVAACTSGDSAESERARAITDHFDTGQQIADDFDTVPGAGADVAPFVCVRDVPARFAAIATAPSLAQRLRATNDDGVLPFPRYTDTLDNSFGTLEHFQGMQRSGNHVIVSGGVAYGDRMSQLVVVEMGTRSADDTFGSAALDGSDRIVSVTNIDDVLWHAGGFQLAHDVIAVALASDDPEAGEIRFFALDVDAPTQLRALDVRITRPHKLYVSGIAREQSGRFVVLLWDDDVIELHRSRSADIEDGFDESVIVEPDDVDDFQGGGCGLGCGTYQALNLIVDCGDGEGALFVVGTRNSNKLAPNIPGANLASLYRVAWGARATTATMSLVERREFECRDRQCNFAAASGVFVVDEERLALYSAYHWLQDGQLLFNEFTE